MTRHAFRAFLLIVMAIPASLSGQEAKAPDKLDRKELVPIDDWVPKPGDQAIVWADTGAFAAADMFAYRTLAQSLIAKDNDGVNELVKAKRATIVPDLTRVLVIERQENEIVSKGVPAVECRLLEGANKGKSVWMMEADVKQVRKRIPNRFVAGDRVTVKPSVSKDTAIIGLDPDSLVAGLQATQERDKQRLAILGRQRKVLLVKRGATGHVIICEEAAVKVKLESGPHKGTSGWMFANDLSDSKDDQAPRSTSKRK